MLPPAHLVHQMRGRLRVRIPSQRQNREYFAKVREQFPQFEGLSAIETNYISISGSVLILHDSSLQAIEDYAAGNGLFRLVLSHPNTQPLSQRIAQAFNFVGGRIDQVTDGAVDSRALIFLVLTLAGGYQVLRSNVWPAGFSLLWYAGNLIAKTKAGEGDSGFAGRFACQPSLLFSFFTRLPLDFTRKSLHTVKELPDILCGRHP